jgi:uncharacterized protein
MAASPPGPRSPAFLGTGWGFPPTFPSDGSSVRMVHGEEDIRESLHILLSTVPGERVMVPTYGCDLSRYVFRALTTSLISEIKDVVTTAVVRWEPRIDLLACLVRASPDEPGLLLIELAYRVRATNSRSNMVYPFYLNEATLRREA